MGLNGSNSKPLKTTFKKPLSNSLQKTASKYVKISNFIETRNPFDAPGIEEISKEFIQPITKIKISFVWLQRITNQYSLELTVKKHCKRELHTSSWNTLSFAFKKWQKPDRLWKSANIITPITKPTAIVIQIKYNSITKFMYFMKMFILKTHCEMEGY